MPSITFEEAMSSLCAMFPSLRAADVERALRQNGGLMEPTVEALLAFTTQAEDAGAPAPGSRPAVVDARARDAPPGLVPSGGAPARPRWRVTLPNDFLRLPGVGLPPLANGGRAHGVPQGTATSREQLLEDERVAQIIQQEGFIEEVMADPYLKRFILRHPQEAAAMGLPVNILLPAIQRERAARSHARYAGDADADAGEGSGSDDEVRTRERSGSQGSGFFAGAQKRFNAMLSSFGRKPVGGATPAGGAPPPGIVVSPSQQGISGGSVVPPPSTGTSSRSFNPASWFSRQQYQGLDAANRTVSENAVAGGGQQQPSTAAEEEEEEEVVLTRPAARTSQSVPAAHNRGASSTVEIELSDVSSGAAGRRSTPASPAMQSLSGGTVMPPAASLTRPARGSATGSTQPPPVTNAFEIGEEDDDEDDGGDERAALTAAGRRRVV